MTHNGADPTVGLTNRVNMPHPGQQQNCIFPEISCKYHFYGKSLVSDQNSWSALRKSFPVYGSSKQVIRFSDSKMHFRWLAQGLPPWRISWWREQLRQKQSTTPGFKKQIYLMCLCEIVCNGIWQRQLLILKFEKGFFGRSNNIFLISKYGSIKWKFEAGKINPKQAKVGKVSNQSCQSSSSLSITIGRFLSFSTIHNTMKYCAPAGGSYDCTCKTWSGGLSNGPLD